MATEWITQAAKKYREALDTKQREDGIRQRREELKQARLNRIATEGLVAGEEMWADLQSLAKLAVGEFNEEFGEAVMRTEARGDGTFKVCFGEPGGVEKIAALKYASETTTLSWEVFGGAKGTPLTVGLKPNSSDMQSSIGPLQFTDGTSYYDIGEISRRVISNLLS